jgi:hypothetical protein
MKMNSRLWFVLDLFFLCFLDEILNPETRDRFPSSWSILLDRGLVTVRRRIRVFFERLSSLFSRLFRCADGQVVGLSSAMETWSHAR